MCKYHGLYIYMMRFSEFKPTLDSGGSDPDETFRGLDTLALKRHRNLGTVCLSNSIQTKSPCREVAEPERWPGDAIRDAKARKRRTPFRLLWEALSRKITATIRTLSRTTQRDSPPRY